MRSRPPRPRAARRRGGERGFTISELVLVLAVLGGLIAIIVVSVNGIDGDAAERECRTELRTIKAATEQFKAEIGFYPPDDEALDFGGFLARSESPNWEVVTLDEAEGPTYRPEGDRCA
jgi:prepilin-type N-terminal cleavage/methylation domain-containing protein